MQLGFSELDALRSNLNVTLPTEAQAQGLCAKFAAALQKQVVLQQYARHLLTRHARNTEPWMARGEQLYTAFAVFHGDATFAAPNEQMQAWSERVHLGLNVLLATPYLWSCAVSDLVKAAPLPDHVIGRELLPWPFMFWSEEVAYDVVGSDVTTNWTALMDSVTGVNLFCDETADTGMRIVSGGIKYGTRFPGDLAAHPAAIQAQRRWLQRLAFLRSPYVESDQVRLPRAWRRAMRAAGVTTDYADSPVHVVRLRRAAQQAVEAHAASRHVEWTHQWWVSGHYRAQWYPSKEAHEVIWIAPHLKGPPDAPVASTVYAVTR